MEVDYWKSEVNAFIVEVSFNIPPLSNKYIYICKATLGHVL